MAYSTSESLMWTAVALGKLEDVKRCLRDGIPANLRERGSSLLTIALFHGHRLITELLLKEGASALWALTTKLYIMQYIKPTDSDWWKMELLMEYIDLRKTPPDDPAFYGVTMHNLPVLKMFLARGANPNAQDRRTKHTMLYKALYERCPEAALALLEKGADPLVLAPPDSSTLFHTAVHIAASSPLHLPVLKRIIELGFPLNFPLEKSPLMSAIASHCYESVIVLLASNTNPNLGSPLPLDLAISRNDAKLVHTLLCYGANPPPASYMTREALCNDSEGVATLAVLYGWGLPLPDDVERRLSKKKRYKQARRKGFTLAQYLKSVAPARLEKLP